MNSTPVIIGLALAFAATAVLAGMEATTPRFDAEAVRTVSVYHKTHFRDLEEDRVAGPVLISVDTADAYARNWKQQINSENLVVEVCTLWADNSSQEFGLVSNLEIPLLQRQNACHQV